MVQLCVDNNVSGQAFKENFPTDTILLKDIRYDKVLAYKLNSVTVLVDYNSYIKAFQKFWKQYKIGMRSLRRSEKRGDVINPDYEPRYRFLDSLYKILRSQSLTSDTIYLNQSAFSKYDLGPGYDFTTDIDRGDCAIFDRNNNRHFIILRQEDAYQRDFLDGWGDFRYFLIGTKFNFITKTKWVS